MARGTAFAVHEEKRLSRFSDEMFSALHRQEPKPVNDDPLPHRCPCCEQLMPHTRTTIVSVLCSGIHRLIVAVCMIVGAVLRFARLVVASGLCLIGFVGACCRSLGVRIAHPDDRRFFAKSQRSRNNP
jgi:hypothetical protein